VTLEKQIAERIEGDFGRRRAAPELRRDVVCEPATRFLLRREAGFLRASSALRPTDAVSVTAAEDASASLCGHCYSSSIRVASFRDGVADEWKGTES
jgi:hypothetical protein